jgi:hypothetical protein
MDLLPVCAPLKKVPLYISVGAGAPARAYRSQVEALCAAFNKASYDAINHGALISVAKMSSRSPLQPSARRLALGDVYPGIESSQRACQRDRISSAVMRTHTRVAHMRAPGLLPWRSKRFVSRHASPSCARSGTECAIDVLTRVHSQRLTNAYYFPKPAFSASSS